MESTSKREIKMTIKENTITIIIIELQIQNWISQSLVLLKFNVNLSLNGHLCKLYLLYSR